MGLSKFFGNMKLGLKLNIIIILTLVLLLVLIVILLNDRVSSFTNQSGRQLVAQEIEVFESRFSEAQEALLAETKLMGSVPGLIDDVANQDVDQLRTAILVGAAPLNFDQVEIVDAEGAVLESPLDSDSIDSFGRDQLTNLALLGVETTGLVTKTGADGQPEVWFAAAIPLKDVSGAIVGALIGSREINNQLLAELNFDRTDVHVMLIHEGRPVAEHAIHSPDDPGTETEEGQIVTEELHELLDRTAIRRAASGEVILGDQLVYSAHNTPHAVAYMPLVDNSESNTAVAVLANLGQLASFQNQLVNNLTVGFTVFILAAILLMTVFTRKSIVMPLQKLQYAAQQMVAGDYSETVKISTTDELGLLAQAFNKMAEAVQSRETRFQGLADNLEQRTQGLEVVTTISERLITILNVEQLMAEIVNQVKTSLDYYHVHIYLLNESRQTLTVAAGTDEAGAAMLAAGHSIALSAETSLVARSARTGQVVRVDDVHNRADWLPNPLLPDTRSEMVVPILLDGQVIGVLDVQDTHVAGFDDNDTNILRALTNQVAIAIRNAHLFEEVESALNEAQATQTQYLRQAWRKGHLTAEQMRYHYARSNVSDLTETILTRAKQQALAQNQLAVVPLENGSKDSKGKTQTIVAPVSFRNQNIGSLQIHPADYSQSWTEDDLAIVAAVLDQLALSAENLRLFEETRQRAGREATIREITDKLRSAPNLEKLLKIATEELGQHMAATHAKLDLGIENVNSTTGNGNGHRAGIKDNQS